MIAVRARAFPAIFKDVNLRGHIPKRVLKFECYES